MSGGVNCPSALLLLPLAALSLPASAAADLVLAGGGRSDYRIVIDQQASASERFAAEELQQFLEQISGAKLPVTSLPGPGPMILVGESRALRDLGVSLDLADLGDEGFVIRTVGPHLVLAGGRQRGSLYAVYELLDRWLGCRWYAAEAYSPAVSHIPQRDPLTLPAVDYRKVPVFEYREPFYTEAWDGDWAARNRTNSTAARLERRHGGKISYGRWFVHTFYPLLPPEQFFAQHPEYYSEIDGERRVERGQLCLTHPEVLDLVTQAVRRGLREDPGLNILSVSQNDWHGACQCAECSALAEREGSEAGPLLHFVNAVAEAVEPEFPQVAIDTLAYQYTRKPPAHVRPRHNVIVRLCSIECCFSHPLATCDSAANAAFRADVEGWRPLTERLYVWDYATDFSHYYNPFPNLYSLGPNIRFYAEHNVVGLFEQGCYTTAASPFVELRAYLTARCLWEPQTDWRAVIDEFMPAFYGAAAAPLTEMIDLFQRQVDEHNVHVIIWAPPTAPHLPAELIREAERLCDQAQAAVADHPDLLLRAQKERLSVQYVKLMRQPEFYAEKAEALAELEEFERVARRVGVVRLNEGGGDWELDPWLQRMRDTAW